MEKGWKSRETTGNHNPNIYAFILVPKELSQAFNILTRFSFRLIVM